MNDYKLHLLALSFGLLSLVNHAFATNPLIMDQFTADPSARVFEGKIYLRDCIFDRPTLKLVE